MFSVCLRRDDQVRRYSVSPHSQAGWEVSWEEDRTVKRHVYYHDWHRVERMLALFRHKVADLTAQGWQVQNPSSTSTPA